MQSLLEKVTTVEKEAAGLVAKAETEGSQALAEVTANETRMLADTKQKAEDRAEAVISEKVSAAKEEVNKIKQEKEQSLEAISKAAESHRAEALAYAEAKFTEQFLG